MGLYVSTSVLAISVPKGQPYQSPGRSPGFTVPRFSRQSQRDGPIAIRIVRRSSDHAVDTIDEIRL